MSKKFEKISTKKIISSFYFNHLFQFFAVSIGKVLGLKIPMISTYSCSINNENIQRILGQQESQSSVQTGAVRSRSGQYTGLEEI